jgi:hypothetical protein
MTITRHLMHSTPQSPADRATRTIRDDARRVQAPVHEVRARSPGAPWR